MQTRLILVSADKIAMSFLKSCVVSSKEMYQSQFFIFAYKGKVCQKNGNFPTRRKAPHPPPKSGKILFFVIYIYMGSKKCFYTKKYFWVKNCHSEYELLDRFLLLSSKKGKIYPWKQRGVFGIKC